MKSWLACNTPTIQTPVRLQTVEFAADSRVPEATAVRVVPAPNCVVPSSGTMCTCCHSLPRCVACRRHLPPACFPPDITLCQACCNKQEKPHVRASERNIVTEVTIPTARATGSFEAFITHNAGVINDIVDD